VALSQYSPVTTFDVDTAHGPARVHLHGPEAPHAALVLGHGAGGGVAAPDLTAATRAAVELGLAVALVEQPYRVAGRRSPAPAAQLDAAWLAVVAALRDRPEDQTGTRARLPLVTGGRSAGARVACRTAAATGAAGVLCLAFPLQPPGTSRPSRLPELDAVPVPTLVVQGAGDPFGMPPEGPSRRVVQVTGNHSLRSDLPAVEAAVREWLGALLLR
jgi:predicted alpha/beta-hydrolase family hydrolase